MKTKTLKELISSLNQKGVTNYRIAKETGCIESALYKIARGEQNSLSYEDGKKIELLDMQTKMPKN